MSEQNEPAGGVVRRVESEGRATVELVDEVTQSEPGEPSVPYLTEKNYRAVELLANGWVRGLSPVDEDNGRDDGREPVDYYPPRRVNGIFTVEETEEVEE